MALRRAGMGVVGWVCGIGLKNGLPSRELRERLGVNDMALVLQRCRLRWCGRVLRGDDDGWVKGCMECEVEGLGPGGGPGRTWREVVGEDCQARRLSTRDTVDRGEWRKLIKDVRRPGWV